MRSLPLATVLVLAGCHVILPLDQRGPNTTGDAKISAEQLSDLPLSETPLSDVPGQVVDGWPSTEGTIGDAPVREAMAVEGLAPGPCVIGAVAQQDYGANMAACRYSSYINLCDAKSWCNPGWHLCAAKEYRMRGGTSTKPTDAAWIGTCVRESGGPAQSPMPGPCSGCTGPNTTSVEVLFDKCPGGSQTVLPSSAPNVGVRTYAQCWRVGEDLATNEGLWRTDNAANKLLAVMCCK